LNKYLTGTPKSGFTDSLYRQVFTGKITGRSNLSANTVNTGLFVARPKGFEPLTSAFGEQRKARLPTLRHDARASRGNFVDANVALWSAVDFCFWPISTLAMLQHHV
jgi:hypothetical protein